MPEEKEHFSIDHIGECDNCHDDAKTMEVVDPFEEIVWDLCQECWEKTVPPKYKPFN